VKFTPIRVVCQNTLTMALSQGRSLKIAHAASLEQRMELAKRNLGIITTRFKEIEEAFKTMARVQMVKDRMDHYLTQVFPDPEDKQDSGGLARVLEARSLSSERFEAGHGNALAGVKGTLWAAYNGVTEYVDYKQSSRAPDGRLDHVWFGDGYLSKARAYRVAVALAKEWLN
jgi:phage/plasmid-like protein (TIGR03299 family)